MTSIKPEFTLESLQVSKKIDAYCENEEECILVSFLFTKRTPELVVLVDSCYHYLDLIETAESILDHKKKVTVLIIPLLILKNFRLIEFNKEEIA